MKHVLLTSLLTSVLCCYSSLSLADTANPRVDLTGFKTDSGLIKTFSHSDRTDPYMSFFALDLASSWGFDVETEATALLKWGINQQRANGFFDQFCELKLEQFSAWESCGRASADDATLARWLTLLYRYDYNATLKGSLASRERSIRALLSLRLPNGIYRVYPKGTASYDGYALFHNNVEVLSALNSIAKMKAYNNASDTKQWQKLAEDLKLAMYKNFGQAPFILHQQSYPVDYATWKFYPQGITEPMGWLEGYFPTTDRTDWQNWKKDTEKEWIKSANTDFSWGIVALAGLKFGDVKSASCWLKRAEPIRQKGKYWNVIEEVSYQIVSTKTNASNCR